MLFSIVPAPSLRPAKHGLVDGANRVDVGDDKWENGVTFTPRGCQQIAGHVPYCIGEDKANAFDCVPPVQAVPYLLEVGLVWSTADLGADPKGILEEALDVGTSSVLERLSWMGVADVASGTPLTPIPIAGGLSTTAIRGRVMGSAVAPPTLTGTALDIGGTATSVCQAIGMVEAKLLDASDHIGGAGTILMSPIALACSGEAVVRDDGNLVTRGTGSTVIVGNFPADEVIGVIGDIDVYLSDSWLVEFVARGTNEWVGRAERRALAVWNPCGVFSATLPAS